MLDSVHIAQNTPEGTIKYLCSVFKKSNEDYVLGCSCCPIYIYCQCLQCVPTTFEEFRAILVEDRFFYILLNIKLDLKLLYDFFLMKKVFCENRMEAFRSKDNYSYCFDCILGVWSVAPKDFPVKYMKLLLGSNYSVTSYPLEIEVDDV